MINTKSKAMQQIIGMVYADCSTRMFPQDLETSMQVGALIDCLKLQMAKKPVTMNLGKPEWYRGKCPNCMKIVNYPGRKEERMLLFCSNCGQLIDFSVEDNIENNSENEKNRIESSDSNENEEY